MRAALLRNLNEPVEIVSDASVGDPGQGEVRVRIHATGVCHSDLSVQNGTIPSALPCVLGHEGAGEIVAVGDGVPGLEVGDHIIVAWIPPCGTCADCLGGQPQICGTLMGARMGTPTFTIGADPAFGMAGTGTFAEEIVLPWQAAVKIPNDIPFDVASLVGCGVMTGVGSALNAAQVRPGSSCVVFGCGGVGISIIQGCKIAGAAEIVAVDLVDSKLEDAKRFGATHAVKPDDLGNVVQDVTGGRGFDYGFEAIGHSSTIRAAYDATRRGGTAVVVGVGRMEDLVSFSAFEFFFGEKTLKGTMYGSADVRTDFHRMLRLWRARRLDLEGMISRRIQIEDVNDAFDAMKRGEVIRQVIEFK